jgi:hypothetical protein
MNNRLPVRLTGAAFLLLLPLALSACSKEAPAAAALDALQAEYDASELARGERAVAFYPEYRDFASRYRGTEAALKAEMWILSASRSLGNAEGIDAPAGEEIIESIFEGYGDSPHIYLLAESWYLVPADEHLPRFSSLMEHSPHPQVRASATYALATLASRGDATAEMKQRREELLEGLLHDYADEAWYETTYGAIAEAELHPHDPADLEVGDRAPEIEGWNHDGEAMKLSDYLGKVVVLDFWGDW